MLFLIFIPALTQISWLNGDQNRIVNTYINQSSSQIASRTRQDELGAFYNSPLYLPALISSIQEKDRADLLTRTFQKELMRDSVTMDLPSEFGITYFFTDKIIGAFKPLRAHSNNDKFGTITCEIGDNSLLVLNKKIKAPSLVFVISKAPTILEIEYENLEYKAIRLIGKEEGTTEIEILLITNEGTFLEKRKVKVKKQKGLN